MGVNGVPVASHGLILGENAATPSRKLFKHLPDLKTTINKKNIKKTTDQPPQRQLCYILFFVYALFQNYFSYMPLHFYSYVPPLYGFPT